MKISCPSCQSSYKIADEKVQGRTVKVRCRKCGLMIHVNERGVTGETADAAAAEARPGSAIHDASQGALFAVLIAEGDQRDMTLQEVVAAYNSGQVTADTFVWADGQPDWMPLAQVPAIIDALNAASAAVDQVAAAAPPDVPPAQPPAPETPPEPVPAAVSAPAPAAASAPAAAPAPASSLFGAEAAASSGGGLFGAAPAQSPAPAAVREDRRAGSVDLFGQARTSVEDEVATSAPPVAPVAALAAKPTGAREEQSVLFSLAALTAAAQAAPPTAASAATAKDDSGLIDLRALANQSPSASAGPAPAAPVAILDAAPVLGTPIVDPAFAQLAAPEPVAAKKSYGLIIGIGVAVAGLAIAGAIVFVAMNKGGDQAAAAATTATTTETAAPTPSPTPTPTPTDSSAAAPPTGAPTTTATPASTGGPKGGAKGGSKGGSKTEPTSTGGGATAAPPATTKAPPKNKCNCPPGDLACNMACAVK